MLPKIIIVLFLIAIVTALVFGGVFLIKDPSTSRRTLTALSWRVKLQVALIFFLLLSFFMGWLKPHDPRRIDKKQLEQQQQEQQQQEPSASPAPPTAP